MPLLALIDPGVIGNDGMEVAASVAETNGKMMRNGRGIMMTKQKPTSVKNRMTVMGQIAGQTFFKEVWIHG